MTPPCRISEYRPLPSPALPTAPRPQGLVLGTRPPTPPTSRLLPAKGLMANSCPGSSLLAPAVFTYSLLLPWGPHGPGTG